MKKLCWLVLLLLWSCTPQQGDLQAKAESMEVHAEGLENINNHKLAFIQHGLAANQQHQAVTAVKQAFLDKGYVVVTFNSRFSLGKNNRQVENARLTTFKEDLSDIISWAATQDFYSEPFALAGHSLGGASVIAYAAEYPQKVGHLIGITPVVSGDLWEQACLKNLPDFCRNWQTSGFYAYQTPDKKDEVRIAYKTLEEAKQFNAVSEAQKIKVPTLLIAAEKDEIIPPDDIKKLYDNLPFFKQMSVVADSGHNFVSRKNQNDLTTAVRLFLNQTNF